MSCCEISHPCANPGCDTCGGYGVVDVGYQVDCFLIYCEDCVAIDPVDEWFELGVSCAG